MKERQGCYLPIPSSLWQKTTSGPLTGKDKQPGAEQCISCSSGNHRLESTGVGGPTNSGSDRMFVARQLHYVKGHPLSIPFVLWVIVRAARCCSTGIHVGIQQGRSHRARPNISRKGALKLFKRLFLFLRDNRHIKDDVSDGSAELRCVR